MKTISLSIAWATTALLLAGCDRTDVQAPADAQTPSVDATARQPKAPAVSKSVPDGWKEDFEAAKSSAAQNGKGVLIVFSGSDWCHWCKLLEESYLSKPDFVAEVSKDFELVFIDNPQNTSVLSDLAKRQNPELLKQYDIEGFPSVRILDDKGNVLAEPRNGRDETPAEYAARLRRERSVGPIVRKHLSPFEDEVRAGYRAVGAKFANLEQPKDDAAKRTMFELAQKEVATLLEKFRDIRTRAEAAQMPPDIDAERKAFLDQLDRSIAGFEARLKLTWEDFRKMEEASAGTTNNTGR